MNRFTPLWIAAALAVCGCKPKNSSAQTSPAADGQSTGFQTAQLTEYQPLTYWPTSLDLRSVTELDSPPQHLVITNRIGLLGPRGSIKRADQSPWPLPTRIGSRPEYLINGSQEVPDNTFQKTQ